METSRQPPQGCAAFALYTCWNKSQASRESRDRQSCKAPQNSGVASVAYTQGIDEDRLSPGANLTAPPFFHPQLRVVNSRPTAPQST